MQFARPDCEPPRGFAEVSARGLRLAIARKVGRTVLLEFDGCGFRATEPTWPLPPGRRHYEVGDLVNLRELDERLARTQVREIPPSIQGMGALLGRLFLGGSAPAYVVGHRIRFIRPRRSLREFNGLESGVCLEGTIGIAPVIVMDGMILQSETGHTQVNLKWLSDRSRDDWAYYDFLRAADRRGAAVAHAAAGGPVGLSRAALRRMATRAGERGIVRLSARSPLFRRLLRRRELREIFMTNVERIIRKSTVKGAAAAAKAAALELDRRNLERSVLTSFPNDAEARRALERDPRLRQVLEAAAVAFVANVGSEIVGGLVMDDAFPGASEATDGIRTETERLIEWAKPAMLERVTKFFAQDVPKSFLALVADAAIRREEPRIEEKADLVAALRGGLVKGLTDAVKAAVEAAAEAGELAE